MKAITLNKAGGPENFTLSDMDIPVIKPDEVLVQVKATSINPVDAKARSNQERLDWFFKGEKPVVLGWDISGIVTEVGNAVSAFKKDDEVFGMINFPGKGKAYAEFAAAPAAHICLKPSNITHQEAAAASLAAITAWQVLVDTAKIKQNDRILIHAASGGVGHYTVQLARYFGAYVIGTSSAAHKDFVLGLGADEHIDYKMENFEEIVKNADLVVDLIGGNAERSVKVTRPGGTIICVPEKLTDEVIEKIKVQDVNVKLFMVTSNGEDMKEIAALLKKDILRSHIFKTFSLAQIPQAHTAIEQGNVTGKIAINVLT